MYDPNADQSPLNPLPPVVWLLALSVGAVELVLQAAEAGFVGGPEAIGWRLELVRNFGFFDSMFDWMRQNGTYPPEHLLRFVSFTFVHGSFTHAAFVVVFILALGKFVAEQFNPVAVLIIFFGSAITGAALYSVILNENGPLIGGYMAVYGLIGAFTWILFTDARGKGGNGLSAFALIGFFMFIQLVYKILFDTVNDWLAELLAFFVGFALSYVLGPDARRRLRGFLNRVRARE
jgi:membrane associated rhomboid family serine protease